MYAGHCAFFNKPMMMMIDNSIQVSKHSRGQWHWHWHLTLCEYRVSLSDLFMARIYSEISRLCWSREVWRVVNV